MIWALLLALLAAATGSAHALHIQAVQHAGWWEVRYPDGTVAANEIHIPVGRRATVEATLDGAGVIWFEDGHLPRLGAYATVTFNPARPERAVAHTLQLRRPRRSELAIVADARFDDWL